MNRKQRAMAVVEGRKPDRVPTGFSIHFQPEAAKGDAAVGTHLDFYKDTECDLCKVMNENLLRGSHRVAAPSDLAKERLADGAKAAMDDQVELVARIADGLKGAAALLVTIHGPVVSMHHMSQRPGFFVDNLGFYRQCITENPSAVKTALDQASETLSELAARCIDAGADGIYFAALGAQKQLFTDEEYAEIVKPFDLRLIQAAKQAPAFNLLHICGTNLAVDRFTDYPVQVVNWEFGGQNATLEEGFELFGDAYTIMGGLDNKKGPLLDGSEAEIEAETHRVLRTAGDRKFILGAGCTLPTTVDPARLRAAARACGTYGG